MKITCIGVGGAFAGLSPGNSNFLLEENGKLFLIDCGTTAVYILRDEMGVNLLDIDGVYISHSHQDHACIESLAFYRYFTPAADGKPKRPKLYTASCLMKPLWENTWKGGLDCLHSKVATLTDYFECFPVGKNQSFIWEQIKFTPFETLHVNSGYSFKSSFGLFIENPKTGKTAMISGDTVFNPSGLDFLYKKADLILHDCETSEFPSHVHPSIGSLLTLSEEYKKKMWLYHYGKETEDRDFAGFAKKGQVFEI